MIDQNISKNIINQNNNTSIYKRTEYIEIGSKKHDKLIKLSLEKNKLLTKLIEKCDIEVFNNKIIVLRYQTKTIYSEQAEVFKEELSNLFSELVKKPVEVIPFVAVLNTII